MENKNHRQHFIQIIKFPILFASLVAYAIGVGLYSYLGRYVSGSVFWLGVSIISLFIVSSFLLNEHFLRIENLSNLKEKNPAKKNLFLLLGISTLSIGAMLTVYLISQIGPTLILFFFLGAYLVSNLILALPPFSFHKIGLSAVIHVINIAIISPVFGYFLQSGEIHPTLLLLTFPTIFLLFALFLANKLETYYADLKSGRKSIMTVLGWQKGMNLHNLFVLLTYFTYAVAAIVGLPWRLSLIVFLSMPIAAVQFWEMTRIREGLKPRWMLLKISSIGSISTLAYFILFFLWLG